jgi:hypothetical protein
MSSKRTRWFAVLAVFSLIQGCTGDGTVSEAFTLDVSPEFVQGVVPGAVTGVLVTITEEAGNGAPVVLTAVADGVQVDVEPAEIRTGEVAEVWVIAEPAAQERLIEIQITARRGETERAATRSTTVYAWEDDRGDDAARLLNIFTAWLAAEAPELGIDSDTVFSGSFVAPGLLVVSHYLYLSDEWELGLSWHVMIPPDDWSEVYLRPRTEAAPTRAFRLESQQAALDDGIIAISEVPPPPEVVR